MGCLRDICLDTLHKGDIDDIIIIIIIIMLRFPYQFLMLNLHSIQGRCLCWNADRIREQCFVTASWSATYNRYLQPKLHATNGFSTHRTYRTQYMRRRFETCRWKISSERKILILHIKLTSLTTTIALQCHLRKFKPRNKSHFTRYFSGVVSTEKNMHILTSNLKKVINPLNPELNSICQLLALLGAHYIFHVSGLRVNEKSVAKFFL